MTQKEYEKVFRELPRFKPLFEIVRVPKWCVKYGVKKGDRNYNGGWMGGCAIQPSYFKFVGYQQI